VFISLCFRVRLHDEDNEEAAEDIDPKTGSITVEVWHINEPIICMPTSGQNHQSRQIHQSQLKTGPVHERKKMLGSHRIAYVEFIGNDPHH
jgi:hypothetical protein